MTSIASTSSNANLQLVASRSKSMVLSTINNYKHLTNWTTSNFSVSSKQIVAIPEQHDQLQEEPTASFDLSDDEIIRIFSNVKVKIESVMMLSQQKLIKTNTNTNTGSTSTTSKQVELVKKSIPQVPPISMDVNLMVQSQWTFQNDLQTKLMKLNLCEP